MSLTAFSADSGLENVTKPKPLGLPVILSRMTTYRMKKASERVRGGVGGGGGRALRERGQHPRAVVAKKYA